jgi:fatty acid-binding protein DegV
MALIHARKAADAGKSSEEVHEVFKRIMEGTGTGVCSHKK